MRAGRSWGRGRAQVPLSAELGAGSRGPSPCGYRLSPLPQNGPRVGYLLAAASARCLVGRELLLHMHSLVHLLGVKGQAAQRAEGGRHLEAGLEALPAEPAGGRDTGLRAAGCFQPHRAAPLRCFWRGSFLLLWLNDNPRSPPGCGFLGPAAVCRRLVQLWLWLSRSRAGPAALGPARGSTCPSYGRAVMPAPQVLWGHRRPPETLYAQSFGE